MALDLHTNVTIKEIEQVELVQDEIVLLRIVYRVKRGRKDYKLWALPADFRGTGIFPLCYRRMSRYADVLDMNNNIIYTGKFSECRKIVQCANKHYYTGA